MRMLVVISVGATAVSAAAQVPGKLGYQGRLLRSDGLPEVGVVGMTFAIFDVATGGTARGCDAAQVALSDGFYSILLGGLGTCPGNPPAIDAATIDGSDLWLELTVAATTLAPRQRLASVPYAVRAGTAANVRGGTVETTSATIGGPGGLSISSTGVTLGGNTVVDASGKATVATGAGLTGNGSTATPVAVASDGVTAGMLASDAASLAKVSGGAIVTVSGNVGVGTGVPATRLHVDGGPIRTGFGGTATNPSLQFQLGQPQGAGVFSPTQNVVAVATNDLERLRIDASGNVAIGTATPAGKWHVRDSAGFVSGWIENTQTTGQTHAAWWAKNDLGEQAGVQIYGSSYITNGPHFSNGAHLYTGGSGGISIETRSNSATADIRFYTGTTSNQRMIVKNSGNVGIGTASPVAALDVNGAVRAPLFGQVWQTGTLTAGQTVSFNLNGMWRPNGNVGLVVAFFAGATDTGTDNSFVLFVHAHGQPYNFYSVLAQRLSAAGYDIVGAGGSILTFNNNSGATARYTIKQLELMHNHSLFVGQ